MSWQCKRHKSSCQSYVKGDMIEMNNDKVTPDKVEEWYRKKYPNMRDSAVAWFMSYVEKCLEWVGEKL